MTSKKTHVLPKTGWQGIVENWRSDLLAAVSVALVALPLGLGVAVASGAEPVSGLISAIIGGVVVTLFRGSHLAINGPAAGLIAVILGGIATLDDGSGQTFNYVLAAITVAGGLQVLLGLLKLGKVAEIIPSSVIQGIMVAIGIIIFASQIHVALGTATTFKNPIDKIIDVFYQLQNIHISIFIISFISLMLLIFIPKIEVRLFQFFPASLWVLVISIPLVYLFNHLGGRFTIDSKFLVNLPTNLEDALLFPNFNRINTLNFWLVVISITLIASIQTLAMAKAVDKLDPYKRKSNLDKDLIGMGIGTMVSGAIGGLPIITVIVRSTVNIHNNARTKWSNFYHGLLLIVFLIVLAPVIKLVPLAALAAILVHIGFKLASPSVFKQIYSMGIEQLLFMVITTVITLYTDLLIGILCGTIFTLLVHIVLARMPIDGFFKLFIKSVSSVVKKSDGTYSIKIRGIANFLAVFKLKKLTDQIPPGVDVKINMSKSRLVDLTFMDNIVEFLKYQNNTGGTVVIEGLEDHISSSTHNRALKVSLKQIQPKLSPRQIRLQEVAKEHDFIFESQVNWNTSYFRNFQFFEIRPIERKNNCLYGSYKGSNIKWEMADITFNEGFSVASEIHHSTVQVVHLPVSIPKFILEKEGLFDKLFDRIMAFSGYRDIDFELYTDFSNKFLLMGESQTEIRNFFTKELIEYLEEKEVYHIESNGEALLIFKRLKFAKTNEMIDILKFSEKLVNKMLLHV
jgi:MFS superfamily sulfate permease-like transporter